MSSSYLKLKFKLDKIVYIYVKCICSQIMKRNNSLPQQIIIFFFNKHKLNQIRK